jgi:hypothetical protein
MALSRLSAVSGLVPSVEWLLYSAVRKERCYHRKSKAGKADDTSDQRGEQAASNLPGHENVKTTQRHYSRPGRIVPPTK